MMSTRWSANPSGSTATSQYRSVVSMPGIGGTFIAPNPVATITLSASTVSPLSQVTTKPRATRATRQP
jgi:hypothetical protein